MSTEFPEPFFQNFVTTDGWIFPSFDEKKFRIDPLQNKEKLKQHWSLLNSFEMQQGIFGNYRHFYGNLYKNNIKKACLQECLTEDSLKTKNITQYDKLCARECLFQGIAIEEAAENYSRYHQFLLERGEGGDQSLSYSLDCNY